MLLSPNNSTKADTTTEQLSQRLIHNHLQKKGDSKSYISTKKRQRPFVSGLYGQSDGYGGDI